jgi:tagaturonate epimerase
MPLKRIARAVNEGGDALQKIEFIYRRSVRHAGKQTYALARLDGRNKLVIAHPGPETDRFQGQLEQEALLKICDQTTHNLAALQAVFPWLRPQPAGKKTSFGFGDRLGISTPGHIQAFYGREVFPILAQQSMREMKRTGRTMQQVLDEAAWGVFEEGYTDGYGADADHIKTAAEALACQQAGFTMFTIDASEQIDNKADFIPREEVRQFWVEHPDREALAARYLRTEILLPDLQVKLAFDEEKLGRTLLKYGKAISHLAGIFAALRPAGRDFDFEVSLDETESITLPEHHYLVACELQHRCVRIDSLAPRFVGEMQKAIDYIGDLTEFERQLREHAAIARMMGGYKVSVHSGSDKFSAYPAVRRATEGFFHLKTAGTSWVAAMQVIARRHPPLYRECHQFALERFGEDRASYYVTTDLGKIPPVDGLADADLEGLFYLPDSRQLIHLTYGSLLSAKNTNGKYIFREQIYQVLDTHRQDYNELLVKHLGKHLELLGVRSAK